MEKISLTKGNLEDILHSIRQYTANYAYMVEESAEMNAELLENIDLVRQTLGGMADVVEKGNATKKIQGLYNLIMDNNQSENFFETFKYGTARLDSTDKIEDPKARRLVNAVINYTRFLADDDTEKAPFRVQTRNGKIDSIDIDTRDFKDYMPMSLALLNEAANYFESPKFIQEGANNDFSVPYLKSDIDASPLTKSIGTVHEITQGYGGITIPKVFEKSLEPKEIDIKNIFAQPYQTIRMMHQMVMKKK